MGATNYTVLAEDIANVPPLPPGTSGRIQIKVPTTPKTADALALRVNSPAGRELWTWVWPVKKSSETGAFAGKAYPVKAWQDDASVYLSRDELLAVIDRQSGMLRRIELAGKVISLANGPRLVNGKSELKSLELDSVGAVPVVTAGFSGELQQVIWRLREDGGLECRYAYHAAGELPCFGVLFDYPERLVVRKRWLGDGPYRVWKNRLRGNQFNVWGKDYNNTITGYRDWVYPEFKGCFADVRWLQLETGEGLITVIPENIPFVQVLTPELPPSKLRGKACVELPQCGLGFLNGIPPLGSKFGSAWKTGPQGQLNKVDNIYTGSVTFYFSRVRQPGKTK